MTRDVWIWLGLWLAACASFLGMLYLHVWRVGRRKQRMPVAEKLLRGPGESLRKKLFELEDQISEKLAYVVAYPLLYIGAILLQRSAFTFGWISLSFFTVVGATGFAVLCRCTFRLLEQRRRYRLGLGGERAVGEELNRLMLVGCHVFHDVPNDPYGNVDHVVIAPAGGVYAVETKARRKQELDGKEDHKVVFDGRALQFPGGGWNGACLEQAKRQASQLSDWLSKATGDAVTVQPVLALPGWYVDRKGRGEVWVFNARELKGLVRQQQAGDEAKLQRIANQLDQRCRDVEF